MWLSWLSADILINGKGDGEELNHRQRVRFRGTKGRAIRFADEAKPHKTPNPSRKQQDGPKQGKLNLLCASRQ